MKHRDGSDMDMTPRYAPKKVVAYGAGEVPVTSYVVHPAGEHGPRSPIRPDMMALELITPAGSRWYGVVDAYINSQLRMVVIGTPRRDEVRMKWTVVPKRFRR